MRHRQRRRRRAHHPARGEERGGARDRRPPQLGEAEEARRWLEGALAVDPDDPHIRYNAACTWAQIGDLDRAYYYLDQWATHSGTENRDWMLHDPDLDPIRADPRFPKLLETLNNRIAAMSAKQAQPIS